MKVSFVVNNLVLCVALKRLNTKLKLNKIFKGDIMSQQWNVLLREKVNETNFILAKYQNYNSKDQWNCICSSMDWLDVGMTNINKAREELNNSKNLETYREEIEKSHD